jgi:hypothetical protein
VGAGSGCVRRGIRCHRGPFVTSLTRSWDGWT